MEAVSLLEIPLLVVVHLITVDHSVMILMIALQNLVYMVVFALMELIAILALHHVTVSRSLPSLALNLEMK